MGDRWWLSTPGTMGVLRGTMGEGRNDWYETFSHISEEDFGLPGTWSNHSSSYGMSEGRRESDSSPLQRKLGKSRHPDVRKDPFFFGEQCAVFRQSNGLEQGIGT